MATTKKPAAKKPAAKKPAMKKAAAPAKKPVAKKAAAYHQFHAVKVAVAQTLRASKAGGDRRIGVVNGLAWTSLRTSLAKSAQATSAATKVALNASAWCVAVPGVPTVM